MQILIRALIVCLSIFGLTIYADSESGRTLKPDRTDRHGLIEFAVPAGWNNGDSNSGRHFRRDDPAENQVIIYIDAVERPPSLEIDDIWNGTKGKHAVQKHTLSQENMTTMNGFEVREAIYEAEIRGQALAYHDIFLFQDSLQIELSLNTAAASYDSYIADFRATVGSVRPVNAGTTQTQASQ